MIYHNRLGPPDRSPLPAEWLPIIRRTVHRYRAVLAQIGLLPRTPNQLALLDMLLQVEVNRDRAFYYRMAPWHHTDMLAACIVELARDEWFARQECTQCGRAAAPGLLTCIACTVIDYANSPF